MGSFSDRGQIESTERFAGIAGLLQNICPRSASRFRIIVPRVKKSTV